MRVKEVIEQLQKYDPEQKVIIRFALDNEDEIGYILKTIDLGLYFKDECAIYAEYTATKEVKAGAVVKRCILAEDVVVGAGAKVGGEGAIAHVGTGLTIGAGATVKEGAKVFESVKEGVEVC